MRAPSTDEIEALAADLGIVIGDDELADYRRVVANRLEPLDRVEEMPEPRSPPRTYAYTDRGPCFQPAEEDDPFNAWITRCRIEGASEGPLTGLSVGLKDTISVAGVPLTNGSRVMEGYTPSIDATVVRRLLDAGATIAGKNNMWGFSIGASDYGPVKNPNAPEYSIGGSSSGTAAAVAAGEVDVGIGGDQGGSIRIPSSFGGLVGVKPTHGLVPYTGISGADASIDHTGPMTRTVDDAALALEVLAGRDGLDPRQPHDVEVQPYADALDEGVSDVTVGVLQEGFEHEDSDPDVLEVVRRAVGELESLGAAVTEVSVPEHVTASTLTSAIVRYGYGQLVEQTGVGIGFDGWHDAGVARYLGHALAASASDLPASLKATLLVSEFVRRNYGGSVYAKAQNLTPVMRDAYDEALTDVDALVMPTVPVKPPEYGSERGIETLLEQGGSSAIAHNTLPFNATGHPCVTVPCGEVDDAPVGVMFVGERFDEATLFRLASAHERHEGGST